MSLDPSNTFFISDFHFDHTNIIEYCNRPFRNTDEMNKVMLRNYNEVVKDDSIVYFLGDMAFGRQSQKPRWWLSQLRGHITYIKGSHDHGIRPTNLPNCYDSLVLDTGKDKVLLIHSPYFVPRTWQGWTIHGHTHSDRMVDVYHQKVCVCVEATNYRPVSLQQVRDAIEAEPYTPQHVNRMFQEVRESRLSSLKRDHYDKDRGY